MIEIKDIFGKPLYSASCENLREALEQAVKDGADLSRANLYEANLDGADLSRANLYEANLNRANLNRANLYAANLDGANLNRANLYAANLNRADLSRANLYEANLDGADMSRANLDGADMSRANLDGADMSRANLDGADLDKLKKISWNSRALISELLWRAAQDSIDRQMFAAFVGRKYNWCWRFWSEFRHPEREWALGVLRDLAKDDENAPEFLRTAELAIRVRDADLVRVRM